MPINRSLEQLFADFDRRARTPAPSQNKIQQKVALVVGDVVFFSSEIITTFLDGNQPKVWAGGTVASTSFEMVWSMGQWQ